MINIIKINHKKQGVIIVDSIKINQKAPDFETQDFNGNKFKLSDFNGSKNVLIVLNRGFV